MVGKLFLLRILLLKLHVYGNVNCCFLNCHCVFFSIFGCSDRIPTTENEASAGAQTIEKKTRFKRAAKDDSSPGKNKSLKVGPEVTEAYEKFVSHTRKFIPEKSK